MTRPEVLIDGYELSASRFRGIGTYLRHLVDGLADRSDIAVRVLAEPAVELPKDAARVPLRPVGPARLRDRVHASRLPRAVRRAAVDLLHSPGRTPPVRDAGPWVHTLHDLTPLVWTGPGLERERRHWRRVGPRLREAASVIAVSHATADAAVALLGLDARRIVVVPHGIDPRLRPDGPRADAEPHLLWVSSWGPHKGLAEAVGVIDALADAGLPHRLHVAGWNDDWMRGRIDAVIGRARHPDRVDVVGYVEDLAATYRAADALLVTSHAEGFCLPAAEAMACGTPVLGFGTTALPELVGDAGVLVADGDVGALALAVRSLLADPVRGSELTAAGVERVRPLTWEASVSAHVEVFRTAAGRG